MGLLLLLVTGLLLSTAAEGSNGMAATTAGNSASMVAAQLWQKMLPNSPMPIALLELLSPPSGKHVNGVEDRDMVDEKYSKIPYLWGWHHEDMGSDNQNLDKIPYLWGWEGEDRVNTKDMQKLDKIPYLWGWEAKDNERTEQKLNKIPYLWGWEGEDPKKVIKKLEKIPYLWGWEHKDTKRIDQKLAKIPYLWGWEGEDPKKDNRKLDKIPYLWGWEGKDKERPNQKLNKIPYLWGWEGEEPKKVDQKLDKIPYLWGWEGEEPKKVNQKIDKIPYLWGWESKDIERIGQKLDKIPYPLGQKGEVPKKDNQNLDRIPYLWGWEGKNMEMAAHKVRKISYEKIESTMPGGSQSHHHATFADLIFKEDALTPGSTITPYIPPASPHVPLLHRKVADSIPLVTKNFKNILKMFAPRSLTMADDIWSLLDACEHPRKVKGERQACVMSIGMMIDLAMSVLGTRDIQAFSPEVPAEGAVEWRRYKVADRRTVTNSTKVMTCHRYAFPSAAFFCHAIVPTRSYAVTLQSEDDGGAHKMEAIANCHLDTSHFSPEKIPAGVKPGEGAVCHFITRDSIVWVPAAAGAYDDGQMVATN